MAKILLVDDEPNIRMVFSADLAEDGHQVIEAETGGEAFDILAREPVDLIVLDIKLKAESGLDILQKIVAQYPLIPVILCSAYVSFQDDYTSWLARSYVVKSTDPKELLQEVRRVLGETKGQSA